MLTKLMIILQTAKHFAEIQSVQESFPDNLAPRIAKQGKNNVRERKFTFHSLDTLYITHHYEE
ncbi:MAG: hypothetical protein J6M41_09775 [Prevotella sp.]|nr:hypothetical protein [Prevotella sp.]